MMNEYKTGYCLLHKTVTLTGNERCPECGRKVTGKVTWQPCPWPNCNGRVSIDWKGYCHTCYRPVVNGWTEKDYKEAS